MTLLQPVVAEPPLHSLLPFPDPPPREPDEAMANYRHLSGTGSAHFLTRHLGHPSTTLVAGDLYIAPAPTGNLKGIRYPDLMIAFDVDPEAFRRSNAYIISEQDKPPDFVLEIASRSTGRVDVVEKRADYAALGIPEYWRFDETGRFHGTRLSGERLEHGIYQPIAIEQLEDNILQGFSEVLNLNLRWEHGELKWYDSDTGQHITTLDASLARAERAETRADKAEAALKAEQETRAALEARIQELEAHLRHRDS